MSRLYKSRSIVVGDPLEIEVEEVLLEHANPGEVTAEEIPQSDSQRAEESSLLEDARARAAEIIDKALRESEDIRKGAQQEGYKRGYNEGLEKGTAEGYEKGRQQGLDTANRMIEEAVEIKQRALEAKERIVKEAEAEIIRIVIEIARKVLGEQVKTDREAVLGLVRGALKKCTFSGRVTMKVSPEDYDMVELSKRRLLSEIDGITQLDIVVEDALSQGSCLLETDAGCIDAGVEVQLDRIQHVFRELLYYE
ncbi:MAG: FliH/SctL family protein [Clostridia bacterium]|nr:hypothetical protein [Clostridiales bacterium]